MPNLQIMMSPKTSVETYVEGFSCINNIFPPLLIFHSNTIALMLTGSWTCQSTFIIDISFYLQTD